MTLTGSPTSARRTRAVLMVGIAIAVLAIAGSAGWIARGWRGEDPRVMPDFKQITFRRGTIYQARFAPGGQSVVYGASWEGGPPDIYQSTIGSRETTARRLEPATLLSISINSADIGIRTISGIPAAGLSVWTPGDSVTGRSAARSKLSDVTAADWSPDGTSVAVARRLEPRPRAGEPAPWRVEWPLGHVIRETVAGISALRIAPDGKRVGWLEIGGLKTPS